jgi:spermidine/putrescine transport system ATP-binding protein
MASARRGARAARRDGAPRLGLSRRATYEVGITFLYVTHDQEEALAMSARIAVMDEGVVQQFGPPEEIYESHQKTFVAGFIGVSNLFPATVEGEGVGLQTGQHVASTLPEGCEQGASVYCSVRPEKVFLDDLEEGMVSVDGEIVERIYLGTTTQVIVQVAPDVRVVALEQNTARSRAEDRWEIGERVKLGWRPEHALVLR